ncbi:B12-binding domain-containing radical SAM protein [Candidatus Pyrohabitans sp.]
MRAALVMPSWLPEEIFPTKTAKAQVNYWQPLGLLYIASALREAGHEVKFLDGSFLNHDEVVQRIKGFDPDFVGIYANTPLWKKAVKTAEDVKKVSDAFTCAGGPYPTAMGEKALVEAEAVDAVVVGEGELTLREALERLEKDRKLEGVRGIIYREDGRILKNPPRKPIEDLDALPFPARDLLEDKNLYIPPAGTYRRKPVAIVMTSRGCNARCIYCYQLTGERRIRYRSVENVLEEIEFCLEQGYREIRFLDDTFCGDYSRAMRIAEEIKRRGLDFTWFVSARVNQVDEALLKAFRSAGCWAIFFGAESGVQKNLNALRKGITLEQTMRAVKAAKKAKLKVVTAFIFGIPGETYEEALRTIEFAIELDPDFVNFHTMTPFPGTELYDRVDELGRMSGRWENFTFEGAAFIPHTMTKEEIEELRRLAFKRFYSRPRYILRRLLGIRSLDDLGLVTRGLRSLFWIWVKEDVFKVARSNNNNVNK